MQIKLHIDLLIQHYLQLDQMQIDQQMEEIKKANWFAESAQLAKGNADQDADWFSESAHLQMETQ